MPDCSIVEETYMEFLLRASNIKTIAEASRTKGISEQTLYSHNKRGILSVDIMIELARVFEIDTEVAEKRICAEVRKRLSEKSHRKIAS